MQVRELQIDGLIELTPSRFGDDRGYFAETFRQSFISEIGIPDFVQENESLSSKAGTIRGMHFQTEPFAQGKLVKCTAGAIFDVAVDLRANSPTFGKWASVEITPEKGTLFWIPAGFAHGFCTLLPNTVVSYKVTSYYSPEHDKGLAWNDASVGIDWPAIADAETLSAKDRVQPQLAELASTFAVSE